MGRIRALEYKADDELILEIKKMKLANYFENFKLSYIDKQKIVNDLFDEVLDHCQQNNISRLILNLRSKKYSAENSFAVECALHDMKENLRKKFLFFVGFS